MRGIGFLVAFASGIGPILADNTAVPVTYGSAVKLASGALLDNAKYFLRSLEVQWNGRAKDGNIVTAASDETNPEVYWVISGSGLSGEPVKCGSVIKLKHAVSGKDLHVDANQRSNIAGQAEVTAATDGEGEFEIECDSGTLGWGGSKEVWEKGEKVYLKTKGGYLKSAPQWVYSPYNCPRCPMTGEREVGVSPGGSGVESTWVVEGGVLVQQPTVVEDEEDSVANDKDEL